MSGDRPGARLACRCAASDRRCLVQDRRWLVGTLGAIGLTATMSSATAWAATASTPATAGAASAAKRIISVGGDVTEIVFALGQGDRVIAVDDTSLWPEAVATRPKVGL